jgi:subtilisin family serine protease
MACRDVPASPAPRPATGTGGTRGGGVALVAVLLIVLAAPASATPVPAEDAPSGHYIVRFADEVDAGVQAMSLAAAGPGVEVGHVYREAFAGFAGALSDDEVARLRTDPSVMTVAEDVELTLDGPGLAGADTQRNAPWGLDRIDQRQLPLTGSYSFPNSGEGVTAYVVDSGIRSDHTELSGRVRSGFTAIADGNGTDDCNGHGTHVAGTLGGSSHGVAKDVTLRPVRVLNCAGKGRLSELVAGLDWIAGNHPSGEAAVANLSFGAAPNGLLDDAVQAVVDRGVTVTVAAGNDGKPACEISPSRVASALTVAATDEEDFSPVWSNYGSCVDVFAPGVSIRSAGRTSTTATTTMTGTSMAAPHVAGAAAVLLAAEPGLTPAQVGERITADSTGGLVRNPGPDSPNRLLHVPPGTEPAPPEPDHAIGDAGQPGPTTTIAVAPDERTPSTSARFEFTADPADVEFECRLDTGPWHACFSPTDYSDLAHGKHVFEVRATDRAGTREPTPATHGWAIGAPPATDAVDADPTPSFSDVPAGHPHLDAITWMASERITLGYRDGTFRPGEAVRRGAMAAFLYRLAGEPEVAVDPAGFVDVPPDHPHGRAIAWMADSGITQGYPDGTFRPHAPVERGAMSSLLFRFAGSPSGHPSRSDFPDVPPDHPHGEAIAWSADSGVTHGYRDGTFRPHTPVERGAMSSFVFRMAH